MAASIPIRGLLCCQREGILPGGRSVDIRQRHPDKNNIRQVLDGEAEYGVADSILLVYRMRGEPVVLLAPIFQQTPLVGISLRSSGIESPYHFKGKKVMVFSDADGLPLEAMFHELGIERNDFFPTSEMMSPDALVKGDVDVYSGYLTNEPYYFYKKNIEINIIDPKNYGVDFYGDMLFTAQTELKNHPDRVQRFLRASLKGWEYALENPEELIDLILRKYRTEKSRDHLRYEAETIRRIINPEYVELGKLDLGRLRYIANTFKRHGVTESSEIPRDFFYNRSWEPAIDLTTKEKQWLREHKLIRVANETDWPPFDFTENGVAKGYSIDLLNLIADKVGLRLKYENGHTWDTLLNMGKRKEIDLFPAIWKIEASEDFFSVTTPYINTPLILAIHANNSEINSIDDLKGLTLTGIKGFGSTEAVKKSYPEIRVVEVENAAEGLRMVSYGKAAAYLGSHGETDFYIKEHLIPNLKIVGETNLGDTVQTPQLHIGVRKDWPELLGILQKGLDAVTWEEKRSLQTKWLGIDLHQNIEFSSEEQAWIKDHPVLRVAFDMDWPPVEFAADDGKIGGIAGDYLEKICQLLGIRLEPASPRSWPEMLAAVRSGELDFFSAVTPTDKRKTWLSFTDSYLSFPMVIVTRDKVKYLSSMEALDGQTLAVVNGYASHDLLSENHPELHLLLAKDVKEGLMAVVNGKAFAFVGNLAIVSNVIEKEGLTNLKVSGQTPYTSSISMAVPKDEAILLSLLQKALASISSHEKSTLYAKWFNIHFESGTVDYSLVWQVSAGALIILAIILYRNRYLNSMAIQLREAKEEAECATRTKSEFLANMSHEIRTPMNAIIGLSYLTLQMPMSEQHRDNQKKIYHSATSLLRLIDDILDFSKIEAGKLDLEHRIFSLDEVMDELVAIIDVMADEKGLNLEIKVAESINFHLIGDSLRLFQVLTNLATNAIKFTGEGTISVTVELDEESDDEVTLRFFVHDTGVGINREEIGQLFQFFHQADTSITRKYGGTGLGLAISKELIELMGGSITVVSEPGIGTEFTFTARFGKSKQKAAVATLKDMRLDRIREQLGGRHLLLVEDNPINMQVAGELLKKVGIRVSSVYNGLEAVERAAAEHFDCILMDIQMPVMDGLSAARAIRKGPAPTDLPIIAMTANAITGTREQCLKAGMDDYIAKPIKPATLYETLIRRINPGAGETENSSVPAPAPSEPASRHFSHGFPKIEGLNVQAGLNFLGGDRDLYLSMLEKIHQQFRDIDEKIRTEIECGNLDNARNMVHTFKGLAGSMGAEQLHKKAVELDSAMENKATDIVPDLADSFSGEATHVMTALDSFFAGKDYLQLKEGLDKEKVRTRP